LIRLKRALVNQVALHRSAHYENLTPMADTYYLAVS